MIISFPIDNFSQVKDILADIFEIEAELVGNSLEVSLGDTTLRLYPNNELIMNVEHPVVISFNPQNLSWSEVIKRVELFCYKVQKNCSQIMFKINQEDQTLTWDLCPLMRLEFNLKAKTINQLNVLEHILQSH